VFVVRASCVLCCSRVCSCRSIVLARYHSLGRRHYIRFTRHSFPYRELRIRRTSSMMLVAQWCDDIVCGCVSILASGEWELLTNRRENISSALHAVIRNFNFSGVSSYEVWNTTYVLTLVRIRTVYLCGKHVHYVPVLRGVGSINQTVCGVYSWPTFPRHVDCSPLVDTILDRYSVWS